MKISVDLVDAPFHFVATNETGNTVHMDSKPPEGVARQGAGPMELLIMGLGGCSGIDILSMLRKGRHEVDSFQVTLESERATNTLPAVYTRIHAHYTLTGSVTPASVRRAIELSITKYCSVARTLQSTAEITFSFTVNAVEYA
jgi:putative redox protein